MISRRGLEEHQRLGQADLTAHGRRVWQEFERVAGEFPLFAPLRGSPYFKMLDGSDKGTNLYTYFPFLFAEAFPQVSNQQMRRLSLMALLFLHHILIDDEIVDEEGQDSQAGLLLSRAFVLKALQVLDRLVEARPLPWAEILELHKRHSQALRQEREKHFGKLAPYRRQDLMDILSAKSSMAKLVPLALETLTGNHDAAGALKRSMDFFYLADQLFDDFRDWKEDLEKGRYSYLLTRVILSQDLGKALRGVSGEGAKDLVGRAFYLSGLAGEYFQEMAEAVEKAKRAVDGLQCPRWIRFLNGVLIRACAHRSQVSLQVRRMLLQSSDVSQAGTWSETPACDAHSQLLASLADSAARARRFLVGRFGIDRGLPDFFIFDRPLPVRVTAYALLACQAWDNVRRDFEASAGDEAACSQDEATPAMTEFVKRQGTPRGWPAGPQAAPDAATTCWAAQALRSQGEDLESAADRAFSCLHLYRRPGGAWAACLFRGPTASLKAWCEGQPEVSGQVLAALLRDGAELQKEEVAQSVDYLLDRRRPDGLWPGYWWRGEMISSFYCLEALKEAGALTASLSAQATETVLGRQLADGQWGDGGQAPGSALLTAYALRILLLLDPEYARHEAVIKALRCLEGFQAQDGGWESQPDFRVPEGNCSEPWNLADWHVDRSYGTSTLVRDHNRCFTTSGVLLALSDCAAAGTRHWLRSPGGEQFSSSAI